jgi:Peptidase family C25
MPTATSRKFLSLNLKLSLLFGLSLAGAVGAGGFPSSTAADRSLFGIRGPDAACGNGDITVSAASPCFAAVTPRSYRFFVEVPAGTSNLTLEIFDADVGIGGATEATAGRDTKNGGSTAALNTATTYEVFNPAGTAQTALYARGDTDEPIGADNAWTTLFSSASPTAGVWEVRLTGIKENTATAEDINYFGVRACSTATVSGAARCATSNRDLNVFARSFLHLGNQNASAANPARDDYTLAVNGSRLYSWATHGCSLKAYDFDADTSTTTAIRLIPRNFRAPVSLSGFSGATAWNTEDNDGADDLSLLRLRQPIEYGIWGYEAEAGNNGGNHITVGVGSNLTVAPTAAIPQSSALSNSFRFYLPNQSGVAPSKPRLAAQVTSAAAVVTGTVLTVSMLFENPTLYPIVFSAADERITLPLDISNVSAPAGITASQGSASFTSPNVIWNPGTVAAGSTVNLTFTVSLLAAALPTFNISAPPTVTNDDIGSALATGVGGVRAVYQDETSTRFRFGPICEMSAVKNAISTPAVISEFFATRDQNRASIAFSTTVEAGSSAFRIVQAQADGSTNAISDWQLAKNAARFGLSEYSFAGTLVGSGDLYVEEQMTNAASTQYGPYKLNEKMGRAPALEPALWLPQLRSAAAANLATDRLLLGINADGLYRITGSELRAGGLDLRGVSVDRIALSHRGAPVPRRMIGSDKFSDASIIEFYATARKSLYGEEAMYRLQATQDPQMVSEAIWRAASPAVMPLATVGSAVASYSPNAHYSFSSPLSDPYYAFGLRRGPGASAEQSFNLALPGLVNGSGVSVLATLWGGVNHPGDAADHIGEFIVNELTVPIEFDGVTEHRVSASVQVSAANLSLTLRSLPRTPFSGDIVNMESVSAHYQMSLNSAGRALSWQQNDEAGDALGIFSARFEDQIEAGCVPNERCAAYAVDQLQGEGTLLQIAENGQAQWLVAQRNGDQLRFAAPTARGRQFLYTPHSAALRPSIKTEVRASPIQSADTLFVTHPAFAAALNPLVRARASAGRRVEIVSVDSLYAQYSGGEVDPKAITYFLQAAQEQGINYREVILVGGDQFDYRAGASAISFIPSPYEATSTFVRFAPSDSLITDLDNDGLSDISIGRLPVRTVQEIDNLIAKTLAMAGRPKTVLLMADRSEAARNFANDGRAWLDLLGASWSRRSIGLDSYPNTSIGVAQARDDLIQALNQGVTILGYSGHSSPFTWSNSGLLDYARLSQGPLANQTQPSVLLLAGCWGSYHVQPESNTLAHAWLTLNRQGAAALIGSSAILDSDVANTLYAQMYQEISRGVSLGQALHLARRASVAAHPESKGMLAGVMLLGDPALSW